MSEQDGWERQLSDLLKIAAGEPRRQVSIGMVRRRMIRRRVIASAAAAAMAVLLGGVGAAVAALAATTGSVMPAGGSGHAPGVPSYYVQQTSGHRWPVARSRTTNAVTATVRCPWRAPNVSVQSAAPSRDRTFFVVCQQLAKSGDPRAVAASRIYRLKLTVAGRVRRFALIKGGVLTQLRVSDIAATSDGSRVAITVTPGSATHGGTGDILVISTRTGARARWRASSGKPGTIKYPVGSVSLTADGRELAFLTQPRCVPATGGPACHVRGGEEVRALSLAGKGGQVNDSRLLVRQSSIMRLAIGYINAAVISPDGSLVTVAEVGWPAGHVSIAQVSAVTGKQVGFVFQLRTGEGFSYRTFAADPSVRHFILAAGPPSGTISNGWVDHGRLIRLKPFDGSQVNWEVW